MTWALTAVWPLSFLLIAVIDDLCFKKFHNWLFITMTGVGLAYTFTFSTLSLWQALGGFALGGALMLPLVLIGAIGAGDMKFMMCFGLLMGTMATFGIFIYSVFWGALFGLLQSLFAGKLSELFQNIFMITQRLQPTQTNKIPYTVAILLGWLTHVQMGGLL